MTMYDFESCLKARLRWYNDAIDLKTGKRKWVNGFNFPAGDVESWRGAAKELKNTLDMVAKLRYKLGVTTPLGPIVAVPKKDCDYPGIQIYQGCDENGTLIAMVEADIQAKKIQTISYCAEKDEPVSVDMFYEQHTQEPAQEIECKMCGEKMVWEHPDVPGLFMQSSIYTGGDYCFECMADHCAQTNCLTCEIGSYPNCIYAWIKGNGREE